MILPRKLIFLLLLSTLAQRSFAAGAEEERLRGFAEHQSEDSQFDKARTQGERAYLEEAEQWENQRQRELDGFKKSKKEKEMTDDGPEFRADAADKKKLADEYDKNRRDYLAQSHKDQVDREQKHLPTEAHELGLDELRPRYDYRKRAIFGAKTKVGSVGGGRFGGGSSSGSNTGFPPPPTFDDFGGSGSSGGYVPAPNLPEDFGDVPPPPPPPPPGFGNDTFGGGFDNGSGDFTAPPPPPMPFNEEGSGEF